MKRNTRKSKPTQLKIIQIEELSWKKLEQYDKEKTVIFIPLSPLEQHGPHLPVGTDFMTARDTTKEAMRTLMVEHPEHSFVLYPSIPVGYTKISQGFPGTISTHQKAIKTILYDLVSALASHGFIYFVICTFHMDLGHLKAIYATMRKAQRRFDISIIEPWGPYFFSHDTDKNEPQVGFDTKKEVHAGFRETSLIRYQYPYLVDSSYADLQHMYRDLYSPRVLGKTFKELGLTDGYVGSPAKADSNYGRWYFQEIVNTYVSATQAMLQGKPQRDLPSRVKRLMKSLFWV